MLKILRNKSHQKKIYIVIAIAVITTFALGGIHFYNKDEDPSSTLGYIDNRPVSVQDYLKSYKAVQHQVELFYGEKAREFSRFINLKGQAWDRLLLLNYAKKEGIKASDAEVVTWISTQFSLNGKFDELLYKRYVETALRSNPREFEEEVRGSLTISKISERLKAKAPLTEEEVKNAYDEERKQRDIVYGFLSWETQKDAVKVSEEELRNVYSIVKSSLAKLPDGKELSFEEAKADMEKILVRENAVKEAVKKLEAARKDMNAADFEAWLAANNLQVQKVERFKPGDTLPLVGSSSAVFEEKLAALEEGEVSKVFAVSEGAVIVKALKDTPADDSKYAEEKEAFRKTLESRRLDESMQKLLTDLRGKLKLNLETVNKLFPPEE